MESHLARKLALLFIGTVETRKDLAVKH